MTLKEKIQVGAIISGTIIGVGLTAACVYGCIKSCNEHDTEKLLHSRFLMNHPEEHTMFNRLEEAKKAIEDNVSLRMTVSELKNEISHKDRTITDLDRYIARCKEHSISTDELNKLRQNCDWAMRELDSYVRNDRHATYRTLDRLDEYFEVDK